MQLAGLAAALTLALPPSPAWAQTPEAAAKPKAGSRALTVVDAPINELNVERFDVQGNKSLTPAQIEAALLPFKGRIKSLAELREAALALQAAYHQAGHLVTQVILPEQDISAGTVILRVIEGRLARVEVSGNQRLSREAILQGLPGLTESSALDLHALHAQLQLANENPSRRLGVNFRPEKTPGDIVAQVRVQEFEPSKVMLNLSDTGNANSGDLRLSLAWQNTNVFQKDHVATLQYTMAPDEFDAVSIFGGGYRIPFYRQGLLLDLVAAYSDVSSGSVPVPSGSLDFTGKGLVLGGQLSRLLPTVFNVEQRITASLYQRQYRNDCGPGGVFGFCQDYTTRPVGLAYSGTWKQPGRQLNYRLGANINWAGGPKGSSADYAAVKPTTDARFLIWRMDAGYSQVVAEDWQVRAQFEAQLAREALVPGEQFGLGGVDSVRGFDERALTGDRGWRAGLELYAPDIGARTGVDSLVMRPLLFVEGGAIRRLEPQVGDIPHETVASAGLGLRAGYKGKLSAQLDWGRVINAGGGVNDGRSRFHFNLGYVF